MAITETTGRRGVDFPRLTLEDMAARLGISRNTLVNYAVGRRPIPPEIRLEIAAVMRRHAEELECAAAKLERAE
jgi:transcriptional regulator with XRE-family HTH domain